MTGFLEQVAIYLHRVYSGELHRFCIVFPNIRAGLFFRKNLAELLEKPVWAPAYSSLNSLMEEITGLTQADNLTLIFHLFQAFRQHRPTNETFDDFYSWGEMLLNDFDDVDKHLVDARDLFRNVSDLKEIDRLFDYLTEDQKKAIRIFWQNFNNVESGCAPSDNAKKLHAPSGDIKTGHAPSLQNEFVNVWSMLYPIYDTFKQFLKAKSLGYEGMIQREAVRILRESNEINTSYEKYVFIGFNALTPCESFFFKSLQKQDRAIFFWDYDDYYLSNSWHEAGMFMRENIRQFPHPPGWDFETCNLVNSSKHIEIISVPSETGQTRLAGQLLQNLPGLPYPVGLKTVVVLPDEYLLLPMLSSLPESAGDINITMGYPFTCTPANSLFKRLVSLQQHIRPNSDGLRFYHHDVCMILQHPYIHGIIPDEADSIIKNIIGRNRIYVPQTELSSNELLQKIFRKCTQAREFLEYLMEISALLPTASPPTPLQRRGESPPCGGGWDLSLQNIHNTLITNEIEMDVPVFCRLLRKIFASLKIPFSGEPLKGLQIMGMLETRALDFDHVIILSMNEGIFPKGNPKQSFIPYSLRKGFGLTTSERHDAVSAYHFYRLIQRAEDVRLIYNSAATDQNTGEMSRFLSQLIYEPVFNVQQRNITFQVSIDRNVPIVKERTDEIRRILGMYTREMGEEGEIRRLSPSALNSYLDCRLKFYFRYVDGLKEKEEVMEEIDHSVFGKLLHKTMELIYRPYINTEITSGMLTRLLNDGKNIKNTLYRAFADEYFYTKQVTDSDITGRNIIIREVLLKYIMRILEIDRDAAPFTIVSLEEPLDVSIPIHNEEGSITAHVNMHGFIDRLEAPSPPSGEGRGGLRIIDYKTGNAQRNFSGIADLFDRTKTGNHAVLQTLVYAYMTRISFPPPFGGGGWGEGLISSNLYIAKELFKENFDPRIYISRQPPIDNYFDVAAEFETELNKLLSEMFLSDTPFTQTENTKKCVNCPYADICHRG